MGLLECGRPLGRDVSRDEADGAIDGDARVAYLTGLDIPVPEPEAGEPVDAANQGAVSARASTEPDCCSQI